MRRLFFSLCNVVALLFACVSHAAGSDLANPYAVTYPFESAVIHYAVKNEYVHGKVARGKEVLYIEGDNMAVAGEVKLTDAKGKVQDEKKTLHISTPDYVYMVDLIKKTGIKIDNPKKYTKPAYTSLSDKEKKAFHQRMDKRGIVSLDLPGLGKKVGEEVILGRKCDVYEFGEKMKPGELSGGEADADNVYKKTWVWSGTNIRLKTMMEGVGWSSELIPAKIEENIKIHKGRFKVPSGIKVTYDKEMSEFARQRALSTFQILKTGQSKPIKVKLKKRIIKPGEPSKESKADKKSQGEDRKKHGTDNGANAYSERIYNYISNLFD